MSSLVYEKTNAGPTMDDTFLNVMRSSAAVRADPSDTSRQRPFHRVEDVLLGANRDSAASDYRNEAKLLAGLRLALMTALIAGLGLMEFRLRVDVPLPQLLGVAIALGLAGTHIWSRARRAEPISAQHLTAQLLLDVGLLSYALYWVGGSITNPFADLYVVFICLAAITLPWRFVGVVLVTVVAAFSYLVWNHEPLPMHHGTFSATDLDNVAHYVHFVLTGTLVGLFGYRLAHIHRSSREALAQSREDQARRETALNFASLAAGTAHEMGTPLTTITMLVADMRDEAGLSPDRRRELDVIWESLRTCKRSLREMVDAVGADQKAQQRVCTVDVLIESALARARALRPGAHFSLAIDGPCPAPQLRCGPTLRQGLLNILNNAAEASPDSVDVRVNWSQTDVYIDVLDRGPGLPADVRAKLGRSILPKSDDSLQGNGLGAFLASMTVLRHGGRIDFLPRFGGGTCARVSLPILETAEPE